MISGAIDTTTLTPERWATIVDRLDRIVTDAARAYLQDVRRRGVVVDPQAWTRELDRLARGLPTDYERPGLPLAYAVRYMPKRVISLLGALSRMPRIGTPAPLMDIGTGTGAAVGAMQLLHANATIPLTGIDASTEMLAFARCTQHFQRSPATFNEGTIESLTSDAGVIRSTEVVTFSAPFDRTFSAWDRLASALSRGPTRAVLAAEPESRAFLLDSFEAALTNSGWETSRSASSDAPAFMKEDRPLPGLTRFWRHLGSPGGHRPQTWWEPPGDEYLTASRP